MPDNVYDQYPVASWTAKGKATIKFPVMRLEEKGGNRIILRERPYKDGAKLDDAGALAVSWKIDTKFNNTITEPGLDNAGTDLYPTALNRMVESFSVHETGDLVIPTRGTIRARAAVYTRIEDPSEIDTADLSFEFVHDNEDSIDARSLGAPAVHATAVKLAQATVDSAEQWGATDDSLLTFSQALASLEGLVNAPIEYAADSKAQAEIVMSSGRRLRESFKRSHQEGMDLLVEPQGTRLERNIVKGQDRAGRARLESGRSKQNGQAVVFQEDQSIASIAAMLGVDFDDLLLANLGIDPMFIPRGAQVVIPNGQVSRQS